MVSFFLYIFFSYCLQYKTVFLMQHDIFAPVHRNELEDLVEVNSQGKTAYIDMHKQHSPGCIY